MLEYHLWLLLLCLVICVLCYIWLKCNPIGFLFNMPIYFLINDMLSFVLFWLRLLYNLLLLNFFLWRFNILHILRELYSLPWLWGLLIASNRYVLFDLSKVGSACFYFLMLLVILDNLLFIIFLHLVWVFLFPLIWQYTTFLTPLVACIYCILPLFWLLIWQVIEIVFLFRLLVYRTIFSCKYISSCFGHAINV